jgi:hypothetical protein
LSTRRWRCSVDRHSSNTGTIVVSSELHGYCAILFSLLALLLLSLFTLSLGSLLLFLLPAGLVLVLVQYGAFGICLGFGTNDFLRDGHHALLVLLLGHSIRVPKGLAFATLLQLILLDLRLLVVGLRVVRVLGPSRNLDVHAESDLAQLGLVQFRYEASLAFGVNVQDLARAHAAVRVDLASSANLRPRGQASQHVAHEGTLRWWLQNVWIRGPIAS